MTIAGAGELVTSGPLLLALPVALLAGLVSFLSPCCLPLVPGYLGYLAGTAGAAEGDRTTVGPRSGQFSGGASASRKTFTGARIQPPPSAKCMPAHAI